MSNLKKIGKIKGAHGLKGEVEVFVFSKDTSWAKKLKTISLAQDENTNKTQYEVLSLRKKNEIVLLSLQAVTDRTAAEKLVGNFVFIAEELLKSKKGETIFLSEILNFKVLDGENEVGEIIAFSSNGAQDLLVVKGLGHQSEIPFVEPFIKKIDFEKRTLFMNLPEGLINIEVQESESE